MGKLRIGLAVFVVFVVGATFFSLFRPTPSRATINNQISFQGKLVNLDGTNVPNNTYSIVFSIYTVSSGGSAVWTETQPAVQVTDGIFQVALGSVTSLPGSVDFNGSSLYLGIKVGADAEMTPRVRFTASPYAFNSDKLNGLADSNFVKLAQGLQVDSSTSNASIAVNKTGATADILQLQRGGADVLNISNSGAYTYTLSAADNPTYTITNSGTSNIINNLASTGDFVIQDNGTPYWTFKDDSTVLGNLAGSSTTAFQIQDAGTDIFVIDTTNSRISIGVVDANTTLLVLDNSSSTTDPSNLDGATYYNTDKEAFRCSTAGLWKDCDTVSLRQQWLVLEDWTTNTVTAGTGADSGNIGNANWTFVSIGVGGTLTKIDAGADASDRERMGVIRMNSPATVTTGVSLRLDNTMMAGVPSNMTVEFDFGPVNAAAANGLQQVHRIGLHDSVNSASPTDGIYFQYSTTVAAGNWFRCTRNNTAETCTDTGVARTLVANTYQRFKIVTNSAGTAAEFFINEVSVGTNNTNMPAATRSYGPSINVSTVDATIRQWKMDYFQVKRNLTTLR